MVKIDLPSLLFVLGLFFIITQLAFDFNLGTVFFGMALFGAFYYSQDKTRRLEIEKRPNKLKSVLLGTIGFGAYLIISAVLLPFLNSLGILTIEAVGLNAIFDVLGSTQPLAFAGNRFLNFASLGIAGPIIETTVIFMVAFEFFADRFPSLKNYPLDSRRVPSINVMLSLAALIGIITTIFIILHSQAKGIRNDTALTLVAIFAIVSMIMILIEGQALGAIIMHIINNSIALLRRFDIVMELLPIILAVAGIGLVSYLILKRLNISITQKGVFG